jgi:hypothetical protein
LGWSAGQDQQSESPQQEDKKFKLTKYFPITVFVLKNGFDKKLNTMYKEEMDRIFSLFFYYLAFEKRVGQ